jgi:copper chaperone
MFLTFKRLEGVRSFQRLVPADDSMKESMMANQQVLAVNGMSCDGCEQRITSALSDVDGVEGVSADHEVGTVTLQADPAAAGTDVIRGVIVDLGYEVASG